MKDRYNAANRFLKNHTDELELAIHAVSSQDDGLKKDQGIRHTVLEASLTAYKAMMFAAGTPLSSISSNAEAIKKARQTRNGIFEFANTTFQAAFGSSCTMAPGHEYTLRPNAFGANIQNPHPQDLHQNKSQI